MKTFTKYIVIEHDQGVTKVAYLTFQKGGHIYFGFTDKSRFGPGAKLSFHPPNRLHVKDRTGSYAAEALTFFNRPPGPQAVCEWLWFTAVSNPLFVIESGSVRADRIDDETLTLGALHNQSSVQINAYKLPVASAIRTEDCDGVIHDVMSWGETHLRFEISLVEPMATYLQPYVMS